MKINKILVIDDQPYNVASARMTLEGFDCRVVDNIAEAYDVLKSGERFDIVLTDLWLPRGTFTGAMWEGDSADTQIPAGMVFAMKAANNGMRVIICSDSDHHEDRLCSLLDLVKGSPVGDKGQVISFVEARTCPVEGTWENGQIVLSDDWYTKPGPHPKNWLGAIQSAGIQVER